MPEKKPSSSARKRTLTDQRATIYAALIGVVGILLGIIAGAFINPLGQKIINGVVQTSNSKSLAIEQIPQTVGTYAKTNSEVSSFSGWADFLVIYEKGAVPTYKFEYDLPANPAGYAGLAFGFLDSQDLSKYSNVEFSLDFAQPGDRLDAYFKDISNHQGSFTINAIGNNEMTLKLPLINFRPADLKAISEFGFHVDSDHNTGSHNVIIKNVRFTQ
jgi:hypothetical protein